MAAGIVVILVMRMLGEMAAANPEAGSFSTYADKALGRWAGFSIGWLYAWFWIIVLGIEATAGAAIMHSWVPGIDQWVWALILMVVLTLTKMWLFPYLTWVSIASIVALLIGMVILESTRESLMLSLALAAVVAGIGVWRYRTGGPAGPAVEAPQGEDAAVGAGPAS